MPDEAARAAYEAFCEARGIRTDWANEPEEEREVWRSVSAAARKVNPSLDPPPGGGPGKP